MINLLRNSAVGYRGGERLGSELVTNGDFTNWTADNPDNWAIIGGDANNYVTENPTGECQFITDGSAFGLTQTVLTIGAAYKIVFPITNVASGSIRFGDNSGVGGQSSIVSSIDTHILKITAATTIFQIFRVGAADITFDNISIKEIL